MGRNRSETWQQACARRMTATLARKPRGKRSRDYLGSLPRRSAIVVSPDEFASAEPRPVRDRTGSDIPTSFDPPAAIVVIETRPVPVVRHPAARRDRRRPRVRPQSPWNCRPTGSRLNGMDAEAKSARRLLDKTAAAVLRVVLGKAQEECCGLCGLPLGNDVTFDHVVPIAAGGADVLGNLLLAHRRCNERKADDLPTGCEAIWLLAVNARIGTGPTRF